MSRLTACLIGVACLIAPAPAPAADGSLYSGPEPRPGPQVLYQKPTTAPQLRNDGPWEAKPLLVSGASAYRRGEFLYQDFIYDDNGAAGERDPGDPRAANFFSRPSGTYTYPTDPAYAENAADLVELRVKPLRDSTAFRITLNSLLDPALVASDDRDRGLGARRDRSPTGRTRARPPSTSSPSTETRRSWSRPPAERRSSPRPGSASRPGATRSRSGSPPGPGTRAAAGSGSRPGVGLWDPAAGTLPDARRGRRRRHPRRRRRARRADGVLQRRLPLRRAVPARRPIPPPAARPGGATRPRPRRWRTGDLSPFHAVVDFAKLRRGRTDLMRGEPAGVPAAGPMNRILSSHFSIGRAPNWDLDCSTTGDCGGAAARPAAALRALRPGGPGAQARLRPDPAAALAAGELQPVLDTRTTSRSSASAGEARS